MPCLYGNRTRVQGALPAVVEPPSMALPPLLALAMLAMAVLMTAVIMRMLG